MDGPLDPTLNAAPPVTPAIPGTAPLSPTPAQQAEFEENRKRIAAALQMQGQMGRKTPMGQFGNMALQAWNMARKMPQQMAPPTAQGSIDAVPTSLGPISDIGTLG